VAHPLRYCGCRRVARRLEWVKPPKHISSVSSPPKRSVPMSWTKPEAEIVAVTMEVTAYVATL
jgi:coenzyme PQQ precursor peptide PqqA